MQVTGLRFFMFPTISPKMHLSRLGWNMEMKPLIYMWQYDIPYGVLATVFSLKAEGTRSYIYIYKGILRAVLKVQR